MFDYDDTLYRLRHDYRVAVRKVQDTEQGIRYWYAERKLIDDELESLIKDFNRLIAERKDATRQIAEAQSCLRKRNEEADKIMEVINKLEELTK